MKQPVFALSYKSILPASMLLLCTATANAQYVNDYKKSADKYYSKGDYFSAAAYYEKYLEQKKGPKSASYEPYTIQGTSKDKKADKSVLTREDVVYRIAESYRQLHDYGKAEKWYADATRFDQQQFPLAKYWYGVSLRANGKYDEAEKSLEDFLKSYKQQDNYTEQVRIELADVKFIREQLKRKDTDLYKVNKSGGAINPEGANYAAAYTNHSLVFTSTRKDTTVTDKKKSPYINNLYQAADASGAVTKLSLPVAEGTEQGVASFTADGSKMYFTRWVKVNGVNMASIYVSQKKTTGEWSDPVKLNTQVNVDGYSSQQPYISADGSYLLFASNRPGGIGKFDIWYAPITNGDAGAAINAGNTINTKEDEQAPFYHQPSGTLVFASKGRTGMGGFDLYSSKGTTPAQWQAPVNLGYPVNSVKDDIYFTNKGGKQLLKDASISSDRSSACCLELFTVDKTYKKFVTGTVTDCKTNAPLDRASIVVKDNGGRTLSAQSTDANGRYLFEVSDYASLQQFIGEKTDYTNGSVNFTQPSNADADTVYNTVLCLVAIEKAPPPVVEAPAAEPKEEYAYFEFAKYDLKPETQTLLDSLAALLKREKSLGVELIGYTDKMGTPELNQKLSQNRAEACKNYLVKSGVEASRLKATGKGECCPIEPETTPDGKDNPEGRKANRRVEFKIMLIKR